MKISRFTRWVVLVDCLVPVFLLGWDSLCGNLGANPVNFAIHTTGILALIFLLASLSITPFCSLTGLNSYAVFRRPLGLLAFFHTVLHLLIFYWYDRAASLADTMSEIVSRNYLLVGMIGLLVMVPLAVTSTNGMIKRLGPHKWKALHRLAYLAAIAGVVHFYMLVKADTTRPIIFASVLCGLFAYRIISHYRQLRLEVSHFREQAKVTPSGNKKNTLWNGYLMVGKIFSETPEVRTFRLIEPHGRSIPFDFLPGQYLNLELAIGAEKIRRSYSIASPPGRKEYCEITIKRESKGLVSRYLHDHLKVGDLLKISGPAGRFSFSGQESKKIVLIAGGVGITPLMSKIRYLTDRAWDGKITLIYSVKSEKEIVFRSELDELKRRFENFDSFITLTRESEAGWKGGRGRITRETLRKIIPDSSACRFHLCGPTEMIQPLKEMIAEWGVSDEMIQTESFTSPSRKNSSLDSTEQDPDDFKGSQTPEMDQRVGLSPLSEASLTFARSGKKVDVIRGKTVLEIGEESGVEIPFDCRSGICGQCKIQKLSGNVEMEFVDALGSIDRSKGLILACQAHCLDDVVVDA